MRSYTKAASSCPKCGYETSQTIKNYVGRMIGIRLVKCPKCHRIFRSDAQAEWAEMSSLKKLSAIAPRASSTAMVLLGLIIGLMVILAFPLFSAESKMAISEKIVILLLMVGIAVFVALIWWLILCYSANNSVEFLNDYTASIRRTRDTEYVKKIYGPNARVTPKAESIPKLIILTQDTRNLVERALNHPKESDWRIPLIGDNIQQSNR